MHDPVAGVGARDTALSCAIAAASGALWFLAAPDFDLWPLAWLAPAPLCWLIDRAPTPRRARRYAWLAGTVCSVGGFSWVVELLGRYSSFPTALAALVLVALAAYQGLVFWAFAWAARSVRDHSRKVMGAPLPMALIAPLGFACFETVWPMLFPYNLAITQAWQTPIVQLSELTGPAGVTALLFAVGGAIYDLATERTLRRRLVPAAGAAAAVALTLVWGYVRMAQIEAARAAAPELRVGLVQSNMPFDGAELDEPAFPMSRVRAIQDVTADLEARGAALVVWPESAFPYLLARDAVPGPAPVVVRHRGLGGDEVEPTPAFDVPLIVGATTYAEPFDPDRPPYNSAFLLVGDRFLERADKNHLVMFSEHIPGADTFPALADMLPRGSGHFTAGDALTVFELELDGATYRLAPLICLEDTLPVVGRELAARHPHLLVNLTNDTWFGDGAEPWQHLALAVFRAVELRTDLVRAVNSGVTSHVDATGRVRLTTDVIDPARDRQPPAGHIVRARLLEGGHGVYVSLGNLFGLACVLATLGGWLLWPRARRRRNEARPADGPPGADRTH